MKLSANTLKKLVKGACHFSINRGYLASYHFTPEQQAYLEKTNEFWYTRSIFSAGVRIEFCSDATEISFEYRIKDYSSPDNTVDVYCDGVAVGVYRPEEGRGKVTFVLPEGDKEVVIYLPTDCHFEVKNFTVNGRYKATRGRKTKALLIGDSISQGYGTGMAGATYVNALQRMVKYEILNQGIGGFRYDAGILIPIEGYRPEKILVVLGTNYHEAKDYDYEADVIKFYETLHTLYGDTPVLSVTPLWRGDNGYDPERMAWCVDIIRRECAKYPNVTVMDGLTAVPHISECFIDDLHPNAYGAHLYAESIARFIRHTRF
ncbi:MAG: hypothetical protein J6D21_07660 [Clostridia bacterium]|nr:hypothetical protein [Clostridia bacterium]